MEASLSDISHSTQRIIQNFVLIWIDPNIDQSNKECQNILTQLENVVYHVNIFTEPDKCIDFLTDIEHIKVFLIADSTLGQQIIPLIHDIPQLDTICIFCHSKAQHEEWSKHWTKINGIHTDIQPICEALQQAGKQCNQNSIPISFITLDENISSESLDQLDPSFMYTRIFKEILLGMKYNEESIKDFATYCRKTNCGSSKNISQFENAYNTQRAIWWYTYPSFIFSLLNTALRMLEPDIMISMGFFITDLHHQIEELYQQQITTYLGKSFKVYRGQGLSTTDFEKLRKTKGGLMSFNSFLSTTKDPKVSLGFAKIALTKLDMIGILFEITIDPTISSVPFAAISEISYFNEEAEILFSMHTIFRIAEVRQINQLDSLYLVELKLTADDDHQLRTLTEYIRTENVDVVRWASLAMLLVQMGHYDKAEELLILREPNLSENEKAIYYSYLGLIKGKQCDYQKAKWYCEKSLEIQQKILPLDHPDLATSYNNIAVIYKDMAEYSQALPLFQKSLEIWQKSLPPNHPNLAISYNNISEAYQNIAEYSKALPLFQKSLEIWQKSLPPNHPDLAISNNNIGKAYHNMGEYSKSLSFYEKALEIQQKSLPPNHPDLVTTYNNIAVVYVSAEEYSKALPLFQKSLEIRQKSLPPNHPDLATTYNNIAVIHMGMAEYSQALPLFQKSLEIRQKSLPTNHPDLATVYNNLAVVYVNIGEYPKALSFHKKALEIQQKSLPANHPDLATTYNNIAGVYGRTEEYSKALSFYEKALEVLQKSLPPKHPDLATTYNNIGEVHRKMEENSKALFFFQKSLEIRQISLPSNHPDLVASYSSIGDAYRKMGEYSKAFLFYETSLTICQKSLPPHHPRFATLYNNIAAVYLMIGEYLKAFSFYEKTLEICQKSLPPNYPDLVASYNNIAAVHLKIQEHSEALPVYERNILHKLPLVSDTHIESIEKNTG